MDKHFVINRGLICVCLLSFFWGCGSQAEPPKQPQIVRKKIVAKTKQTRPSKKGQPPKLTKKRPVYRPKSDISRAPAVKTAKKKAVSTEKPKMLVTKPKSDISQTSEVKEAPQIITQKDKVPQPEDVEPAKLKKKPLKLQKGVSEASRKATDKITVASVPGVSIGDLKTDAPPAPYQPKGKIDPFEPLFTEKPIVATSKPKKKRIPRTPLEKISLSQLKLVGIILARSGNKALVQEASGKGYIIKKGTYIGLNSGQVVEIQMDNVVIQEEVEDVLGKVATTKTELRLPKPPGE